MKKRNIIKSLLEICRVNRARCSVKTMVIIYKGIINEINSRHCTTVRLLFGRMTYDHTVFHKKYIEPINGEIYEEYVILIINGAEANRFVTYKNITV